MWALFTHFLARYKYLHWGTKFRIFLKTFKIFDDFSRENHGHGGHYQGVRWGVSGVSFRLRWCPQGVASVLCKKTCIFGFRRSQLDNLTVTLASTFKRYMPVYPGHFLDSPIVNNASTDVASRLIPSAPPCLISPVLWSPAPSLPSIGVNSRSPSSCSFSLRSSNVVRIFSVRVTSSMASSWLFSPSATDAVLGMSSLFVWRGPSEVLLTSLGPTTSLVVLLVNLASPLCDWFFKWSKVICCNTKADNHICQILMLLFFKITLAQNNFSFEFEKSTSVWERVGSRVA